MYKVHLGVVQSDIVKSRWNRGEEGVEFGTFAALRAHNNIYTQGKPVRQEKHAVSAVESTCHSMGITANEKTSVDLPGNDCNGECSMARRGTGPKQDKPVTRSTGRIPNWRSVSS